MQRTIVSAGTRRASDYSTLPKLPDRKTGDPAASGFLCPLDGSTVRRSNCSLLMLPQHQRRSKHPPTKHIFLLPLINLMQANLTRWASMISILSRRRLIRGRKFIVGYDTLALRKSLRGRNRASGCQSFVGTYCSLPISRWPFIVVKRIHF
jgi:hypothetical protein